MKFKCSCGHLIRDQTDFLSYKAHVIGDKDYNRFHELIDEAIESDDENREKICMNLRYATVKMRRSAWECTDCGRLYFDDAKGELVEYTPRNGKRNRVFDRVDPRS
jgi:hypothetical protein